MKTNTLSVNKPPGKTALLVIDVQQELFEKSTPMYRAEDLLANIRSLAARAHAADVPVFYVQHDSKAYLVKGTPGWQVHSGLQPLKKDFIIHKQHPNTFEKTNLGELLGSMNISRLVVTGCLSHMCVRATCKGALKLGYQVLLVQDAHSNFAKDAAERIDAVNQEMGELGVELVPAAQVVF